MGQCSVEDCLEEAATAGLCPKHYQRRRKYGSALGFKTRAVAIEEMHCQCCGAIRLMRRADARRTKFCSIACAAEAAKAAPSAFSCMGCGMNAERARGNRDELRYCTRECYQRTKALISAEIEALRAIAKAWKWKPSAVVVEECNALKRIARYVERPKVTRRPCNKCGSLTIGFMGMRRTCASCKAETRRQERSAFRNSSSGRAAKAKYRSLRRARIEHEAECIDPYEVLHSAGWKCACCGVDTPRKLRGSYDLRAPEVDHITPLAHGGKHVRSNLQCLCRGCNLKKGGAHHAGGAFENAGGLKHGIRCHTHGGLFFWPEISA